MTSTFKSWRDLRRTWRRFIRDRRALAAVEFAFIVPLMLVLFFGTVEFSQGVAVDRKVTLTAGALSNLTSETPIPTGSVVPTVADADLQNMFTASISIMTPYSPTPTIAQISEIYIDSSKNATVSWSKAATIGSGATQATLATSTRNAGDNVTSLIPSQLLIKQTYLILSEVSYRYVPAVGYVMSPTGVNLSDSSYSRPRLGTCIVYNNVPVLTNNACPLP
jgi:Flp pilus assembly protein TadG